jgi:hypothetical protein
VGRTAAAALLGLTLGAAVGCQDLYGLPDKQPEPQPEYGVADTSMADSDDDGWRDDEDCAPDDPTVHPEAEETPDDGVDSDCDGQDDT